MTVIVLGPEDEYTYHDENEEDEDDGEELLNVMMPPTVDQVGKSLEVSSLLFISIGG